MDPQHGQRREDQSGEVLGRLVPEALGGVHPPRYPGPRRECGSRTGSGHRAAPAEADCEARRLVQHQDRRRSH